jgi:glycosyltransferase involved in cell wall biosynthesis
MARQLMGLLDALGHDVRLVSRLRARLQQPDDLPALEKAAAEEARLLSTAFRTWRPDLWFTYHLYYRAPDLLGPGLAAQLGIPYVAAEASHAAKRATGEWAAAHAHASDAIGQAAILFALTARDAQGLEAHGGRKGRIIRLAPFLSEAGPEPAPRPAHPDVVSLVTVAMMREGGKLASYRILADALQPLQHLPWRLGIVGDGAARTLVEDAFARFAPGRIIWHGQLGPSGLARTLGEADLFVWPGYNEPFGMVYLEAAAHGLASVGMASGGVADVVIHNRTGQLADHGDVAGLGRAIAKLIVDHDARARLGKGARAMAVTERSSATAAQIVAGAFAELTP